LSNDSWVIEEIKEEIKTFLKSKRMKRTYQNLWGIAKAELRTFIKNHRTHK
jgi:hypothetical protein